MKRKTKRIKGPNHLGRGLPTYRITGPSVVTGKRVTVEFKGTLEQAEKVELK